MRRNNRTLPKWLVRVVILAQALGVPVLLILAVLDLEGWRAFVWDVLVSFVVQAIIVLILFVVLRAVLLAFKDRFVLPDLLLLSIAAVLALLFVPSIFYRRGDIYDWIQTIPLIVDLHLLIGRFERFMNGIRLQPRGLQEVQGPKLADQGVSTEEKGYLENMRAHLKRREYQEAADAFSKVLELNPQKPGELEAERVQILAGLTEEGETYLQHEQYWEAADAFGEVRKLDPENQVAEKKENEAIAKALQADQERRQDAKRQELRGEERSLFRPTAPPAYPTSHASEALYGHLLYKVGGDRMTAERLIAYERKRAPHASRDELVKRAIKSWELDNR